MAYILCVEDDDQVAALISEILVGCGHTVDRSVAAYGACKRMLDSELSYDLVLMDLSLLGANGIITGLALRALNYTGPIVAATGNLITVDQGLYDAVRFAGRLLKPFGIKDLQSEVERQLTKVADSYDR